MAELSDIISINISRASKLPTSKNFGNPCLLAEFPASKTTPAFGIYKKYYKKSELTDDGFTTSDKIYKMIEFYFNQNKTVDYVMLARKRPKSEASETWTQALDRLQTNTVDWYALTICATQSINVTFSANFVASNSIAVTINGTVVPAVLYTTDQLTTMNAIKTAIELAVTDSTVTIGATPYRTMKIELESTDISTASVVVTGGVSQPTVTIDYLVNDDYLEVANWIEAQKKMFFINVNDSNAITASTSDIGSQLKALNYYRTFVCYSPNLVSNNQYFAEGWLGECLPYDVGSQTFFGKTVKGLTSYILTGSEQNYALTKGYNLYLQYSGLDITVKGKNNNEYIDIIRDFDWLEATIAEYLFIQLTSNVNRKIPYNDFGISIIENTIRGVLQQAVKKNVILSNYKLTIPKYAETLPIDRQNRVLKGIEFTVSPAGAIQKIEVQGYVTYNL